ncbi:Hypothetical predicted protein, partial [Scomber scombrus]
KPRLHGNRLSGAARAGSRAAVNGVTSRRRRQRVCSKDRERGEKKGKRKREEREGEGEVGGKLPPLLLLLPLEVVEVVRSALHRRALEPIHHLSVRHQSRGVARNVHSCGSERKKGRKWKNPIAPDVDTDCRSSRLY